MPRKAKELLEVSYVFFFLVCFMCVALRVNNVAKATIINKRTVYVM